MNNAAQYHVGVIGGGQLAQMLAQAGKLLNIQVHAIVDHADCPAASDAELFIGDLNDEQQLAVFSQSLDMLTFEFENVNCRPLRSLTLPIYPSLKSLEISQDRELEKQFFIDNLVPTTHYDIARSPTEFPSVLRKIGLPAVVKTCRQGYDGKGQCVVKSMQGAQMIWETLQQDRLIVEQFYRFDDEVSIIAVRSRQGDISYYPLTKNQHRDGILRYSKAPYLNEVLQIQAESYAERLLTTLDYVGVLAIEFFHINDRLIVNEIAPRVHNSGHWTIEGAQTSQFENHLRALCGLSLGETKAKGYSQMINFIGEVPNGIQQWHGHIHLYNKRPRPGRKLGHATFQADTIDSLQQILPSKLH